jgi:tetratricopeptide (TPR) repeat protein
VLLNLGRVEQARARLREVLDEVDPAAPASAPWVLGMARVAVVSAERAAADELTGRALALGAALGDRALLADAASLRADALLLLDRPQEALDAYRRAEELLGADGDPDERVRVLLRRGLALMGSDQDAGPALRAGLDLALRTGNATGRGFAAVLLAEQDMWRGRWDEAERRVREELETSPQPPREHGMLHAVLAQNSALRGRVDQLGDSLASLGALARTGSGQLRAVHAVVVGLVAAATGDLDRAFQQWSGTVRAFAPRAGWYLDPVRHAWPLALDAALRTGRRAEAADLLALVAGRPADRVPPFLRAQLLRFRARLRAGDGGAPDAVEQDLRAAVTGLDVLGYPYWRAVAQADLAAWLGGTGRGREAAAVAEQAAATCRELGVERVPAHG